MASLVSKSYSKKLLRLISWSHWFTFFNIIAAILLSSFYLFAESAPETLLGKVYLITTWFSHMAFLTFVCFVLIVFPITVLFPYTRFIRGFASLVFTITLAVLVLDAFTYQALGYHLSASSFEQVLTLIENTIEKDSFGFFSTVAVVTTLILLFELVVSNYAWKHIHQLQQTVFARYSMMGLVSAFVLSHVIHIWADANLHYDVLKQDTLFPISHPATAKTLLTKYGLFDKNAYIESKTSPLSFNEEFPVYPTVEKCFSSAKPNRSVIMVLNKNGVNEKQIEQFAGRASSERIKLAYHIDNANSENAWFNFLYGLPNLYQANILSQNKLPVTLQVIHALNLSSNLTVVNNLNINTTPSWTADIFANTNTISSIEALIFNQHFAQLSTGIHIYYFDNDDDYQLSLFVDALMLHQQNKSVKDIIWVSGLGNKEQSTQLINKAALMIWPNAQETKLRVLTSQMDITPTLLSSWLNCSEPFTTYSTGQNLLSLKNNRIIANSVNDGLMIFEKDKSVFVDSLGNFQGYSRQLNAPIIIKPDYPLMINGVKNIKAFQGENILTPN